MADRKDLQVRPFNEAGFKAAMERIAKSRGIDLPASQARDDFHELPNEPSPLDDASPASTTTAADSQAACDPVERQDVGQSLDFFDAGHSGGAGASADWDSSCSSDAGSDGGTSDSGGGGDCGGDGGGSSD